MNPVREALEVIRRLRRPSDVVVTSMGSAREWMAMGPLAPLDFVYVPSSMGEAPSLALGIALAQPQRRVIVCSGDGSLLMNLGALVTIAGEGPKNLVVMVFDNGVYEVTGAQPVPGKRVDYLGLAHASGFTALHRFDDVDEWRAMGASALAEDGPVFIVVKVPPVPGAVGPKSPGPTSQRAAAFAAALQSRI